MASSMNGKKSGAKFSVAKNSIVIFLKLTTKYQGEKVFKVQSPFGKVSVHKYCTNKIQEEQLIPEEQFKSLDDSRPD